jgi:peptidoglycan/xylan/chitin deacetylase (PgdA/CDA1 family)
MRIYRRLRYLTKLLLAACLFYSGIMFLVLRRRFRGRGVVLLYHRVLPAAESAQSFSSQAIIVSPSTFERHLRFLQRHFSVVGPEEFHDWLVHGRRFPKPPCLITFDDGWKDNLVHAVPILRAQSLPAIIFLPTDYIGTGKIFWQERLSRLLFRLGQQPALRQHPLVSQHGLTGLFGLADGELAGNAVALARHFKNRGTRDIEQMMAVLGALLSVDTEVANVDSYLDWDNVKTMRADRIYFGSHTISHRILTQLDPASIAVELSESKRILEQRLNAPIRFLAYPNGNHDAATCDHTRQAGYQLAFTTVPGVVARGDDPMRIRRFNIHDGGHRHMPLFCASITGVF